MSDTTLSSIEALLFRQLREVFGGESVFPRLSVAMICGHDIPQELLKSSPDLLNWSRENSCLFTVVDADSRPRMVIDCFDGFEESIDLKQLEHQRFLPELFLALEISYVTLSATELGQLSQAGSREALCEMLQKKLGDR